MATEKRMSGNGTHDDATQDDPIALARAFAAARYRLETGAEPIEFGVGECAPEVEASMPAPYYAFITAWNPEAESQPVSDNARSDDVLVSRLDSRGMVYRRTWAQAPDGGHREAGWLIVGLDPDRADALGRDFEQAGILSWCTGGAVGLHMRMPRPAGAPLPHGDWIE
jgi:hypothetical protein